MTLDDGLSANNSLGNDSEPEFLTPGAPLAGYTIRGAVTEEFSEMALDGMRSLSDSLRAHPAFGKLDESFQAYIETELDVSPLGETNGYEIKVSINLQESDPRIHQDTAFVKRELIDIAQSGGLSARIISLFSSELPEGKFGITRSKSSDSQIQYSLRINSKDFETVQEVLSHRRVIE